MTALGWLLFAALYGAGITVLAGLLYVANDEHRRQRDGVTEMLLETREALAREKQQLRIARTTLHAADAALDLATAGRVRCLDMTDVPDVLTVEDVLGGEQA